MTRTLKFKILLLVNIYCLLIASSAGAAVFYFSPPHVTLNVGDEIEVFLMLDAEEEQINAIEGRAVFSKDKLNLTDIRYEDSVINLWIENPTLEKEGEIIFAGITPGGFDGVRSPFQKKVESGKILTLVLKAKNAGSASVVLQNVRALLNDGEGTETDVSLIPFSVDISGEARDGSVGLIYSIIIVLSLLFIYILWKRKKS